MRRSASKRSTHTVVGDRNSSFDDSEPNRRQAPPSTSKSMYDIKSLLLLAGEESGEDLTHASSSSDIHQLASHSLSTSSLAFMPASQVAQKRPKWYEQGSASKIDVAKLSKEESARQEVIFELETTEEDYVMDIEALKESYMKVLAEACVTTLEERTTLFSNITTITTTNRTFLDFMRQRRRDTSPIEVIGDAFFQLKDGFPAYYTYCANHAKATKLLKNLLANPEFKRVHDQVHFENPRAKNLSLESYLIKPVQRICKYPLILREIIKNTAQTSPDLLYLSKANELLDVCLKTINEKMPAAGEEQRILLLQSMIESPQPLDLADGSRRLLFEGKVLLERDSKTKERYLILFTDKLLICNIHKSMFGSLRYPLKFSIPTEEFLINAGPKGPIEESKDSKDAKKKAYFQFIWAGNAKFGVYCESEPEKESLVQLLDKASMAHFSNRKKSFGRSIELPVFVPATQAFAFTESDENTLPSSMLYYFFLIILLF